EHRGRRYVGQVAARTRLGVPLAPELGDVEDPRQKALLLLGCAVGDQRRAEQLLTEMVDLVGGVGARVFLIERHAVRDGKSAPAALLRPPRPAQTACAQSLFPRPPLLEGFVLAPGPAEPLELGELADEVVGEPCAYLGPELLDLSHPCRLTYQALALLEERR